MLHALLTYASGYEKVPHSCLPYKPMHQVMRRYHIQDRDDYKKYNKIVGMITKLTNVLKQLDPQDATRIELTEQLLEK